MVSVVAWVLGAVDVADDAEIEVGLRAGEGFLASS
jgi:hypothetical protein